MLDIKPQFFLLLFLLISCGVDPQGERDQAILTANIQLSSRNCNDAISALEAVPFSWEDPTFLKTLSLSYACKGKFDVLNLFTNDLPLFGSVNDSPLGGLSIFSTSTDMESHTDTDFLSMNTALDYLIYAGGISKDENPTHEKRKSFFESQDLQELEMLAFYEILVNLGRFLNYYGNVNSDGEKGAGSNHENKCFLVYDNFPLESGGNLRDFFGLGITGSCTKARAGNSGHEFLYDQDEGTRSIERLCQGVVLFNNFFAIIPHVLESITGQDFDEVSDISNLLSFQLAIAEAAKSGVTAKVGEVLSQDLCVSNNVNDDSFLQVYYAIVVEVLLQ